MKIPSETTPNALDSPTSELERELYRAAVTLYRWKNSEQEWVDVGPGRVVFLEVNDDDQPFYDHQLVFRSSGTFKTRSLHLIQPGKCSISDDFPTGVEVEVQAEQALKAVSGGVAPPARLCFVFEDDKEDQEERCLQLATEFRDHYQASQAFAAREKARRTQTLATLGDLVARGVIRPGKEAISCRGEGGEEVRAELRRDGRILYGSKVLETVSGFVHAVKVGKKTGKYVAPENGWLVTEHNGRLLNDLRFGRPDSSGPAATDKTT